MSNLDEARQAIKEADEQIAALFEQRMHAAGQVAAYKKEHGLPIFDAQQEERVFERNRGYIKDSALAPYFVDLSKELMEISKRYQHFLVDGVRVAYCGIEGAFAQIASARIFPTGKLINFKNFEETYQSVEQGECDCAVLPIENSYQGEVGQVMDLMFKGNLVINGIYELPVRQHLMSIKGANISDIKTVTSHPQALGQCEHYLSRHGFERVESSNTAMAAQQVATQNDPSWAAIASEDTAQLYGLEILEYDINKSNANTTRFAVFCRTATEIDNECEDCTSILLFTVKHEAGALARAINVISEHDFNMKALRSRPMKNQDWNYGFYVEAEGNLNSWRGQHMLNELAKHCSMLKVAGCFLGTCTSLDKED